jgi:membrane fusion protein (multidrug efflux system)
LGSLIDEGELMTTLSDNSTMFAYFNVSEPEYLNYKSSDTNSKNNKVSMLLANNQPLSQKGVVETIESEFNGETGNIAFRAKFPNPEKLLRHGETGKVQMTVPLKDALVIPQKATYEVQDKTFVFVIGKDNVVHARNITILSRMPDLFIVGSGMSETDHILLEGVQKVKENDKIISEFIAPREVISRLKLYAE